jgi:glycosyltransferase involved in cell wall biosynthesis
MSELVTSESEQRTTDVQAMHVSVVVPTRNRIDLLESLLRGLLAQTASRDRYEIIVVDDGSTDSTPSLLDRYTREHANLRRVRSNGQGPARARNAGLALALGDVVAFTDDDCVPDSNWIEVILEAFHHDRSLAGLEGLTYTTPELVTPLTHQIVITEGGRSFVTCNIAYRRDVLLALSGFDDDFETAHNEDVDLAWRVMERGPIRFCSDMRVSHPPRPSSLLRQVRWVRNLVSEFRLYYKHTTKYRSQRAYNPWLNIFGRFLLRNRLITPLTWLKRGNVRHFFGSLVVSSLQGLYLVGLVPALLKAQLSARRALRSRPVSPYGR